MLVGAIILWTKVLMNNNIGGAMHESKLRQMRKRAGVTAYAFAGEAGIDRDFYYKLERGERGAGEGTLVSISRALAPYLDVTPADVLAELTGVNDTPTALGPSEAKVPV